MKAAGIKIYHFSKWTLFILLICVALLTVAGQVLLGNVMYFKNNIVSELADYGIKGVALENVEGQWQGWHPVLKVKGASLSIPGRSDSLFISELSLRVKLLSSLFSGDLVLESLHSTIQKIILVRDADGLWWLNDIPLTASSDEQSKLDIYAFFERLPAFIDIDIGLIQLRDLRGDVDYLIQQTSLRSSREQQKLALQLTTRLAASLGQKFELQLEGDEFKQQLYVQTQGLNVARILSLLSVRQLPLQKAQLSIKSWLTLEQFQIRKILTQADLSELVLKHGNNPGQGLSARIQSVVDVETDQWRVHSRLDHIQKGAQRFADMHSQLLISKGTQKPMLWVNQLDLSLLSSLVIESGSEDAPARQWMAGIRPRGQINNIVAQLDSGHPAQSLVGFDFKRLNTQVYRAIPGLSAVNGHLLFAQGRARLDINSRQVSVDFDGLFRAPLEFDRVKTTAYIDVRESFVNLESDNFELSNADLDLTGRFWLEVPADGPAFMSLRSSYRDGDIQAAPRYLPVSIMSKNVVKWLDESIRGGELTEGDFLFHGRLIKPSILEQEKSGIMHASLRVKRPQVQFLKDWPEITQGEGQLDFINTGLNADFNQVQFAASRVKRVHVGIADFLHASVSVNAEIQTASRDLLETLSSLPVLNAFKDVRKKTQSISGEVEGQLKLDIPLYRKSRRKVDIEASAQLKDVALSIPHWMVGFTNMNGRVHILNDEVSAQALNGLYYGDRIRLTILPESQPQRTSFKMNGELHSQNLLKLVPQYLQQPVSGMSAWDMMVSVNHEPTAQSPLLSIQAESNLDGTRFQFPQPARIIKDEQSELLFTAELYRQGVFQFNVDLEQQVNAHGQLNLAAETSTSLDYLDIGLGSVAGEAKQKGISIAGSIKRLNIDDWIDYIARYFHGKSEDSVSFLKQINEIDLVINNLAVHGQQAKDSKFRLTNNGSQLQGSIDSTLVKGSFELPYKMGPLHPLIADLEYINLTGSDAAQKITLSVSDMPNLLITSKAISFKDMIFSDLILSTRVKADDFLIDRLDFSRDQVHLKSSGKWQFDALHNNHVSVFNINIEGTNFGQTVQNLGLGESIKGGHVEFNGQIGWGGELYNINWPSLLGEVSLKLEDGYLKNVEPGAGRFVGLLSFNALPKRLFLDFGDVVKEGMQFNSIKGEFKINGEVMDTENASLDSVSARVDIKGTTNLREQTYDQTMIIVPKIGDTLPLLGTLAAGNTVGWGLLLLQKIFKKPIEKSVEIEYRVTGSWDKPEVTLVKNPNLNPESDRFYETDF